MFPCHCSAFFNIGTCCTLFTTFENSSHISFLMWSYRGWVLIKCSLRVICFLKAFVCVYPFSPEGGLTIFEEIHNTQRDIALQCLFWTCGIEWSQGSYCTANTGLFVVFCLCTFLSAICLGMDVAFLIALSMDCSW